MAAFASAADLAAILQRTFSAAETAAANIQLDLATAAIRNYTRQTISLVEDDVVMLRSTTRGTLILPERPVVDVSLVRLNTVTVAAASYTLIGAELQWGANVLNVGNLAESAGGWGSAAAVEVTYTHGFATIPDDIRSVCLSLAQGGIDNPGGIQREQVGPDAITYAAPGGTVTITKSQQQMLNRYRLRARS